MSSTAPGPRPRQVTISGWVIAVASAMLVASVFDTMANLHSIDTRDMLTKALTTGSAKQLGISVEDAITLIRAGLFVAGVAGVVTGILGVFVLQRHATARIVLTIAAVPVVLTAPVAGGVLGLLIGASTAALWTRPARDWFAGRPTAPPSAEVRDERARPTTSSWSPPTPTPSATPAPELPPPTYGWGQEPSTQPGPVRSPVSSAWPAPQAVAPGVPTQVRVACILTWVFSALTGGVYLLLIAALAIDRNGVLDLLRDNRSIKDTSLTDSQLVGVLVAVSAFVVLWCVAAALLAGLTWRRHPWAWRLLLLSIGVAGLVEVVGLPYSLLHLTACVTAFALLLRAPVRAWIARRYDGPDAPASWPGHDPGRPAPGGLPPQPPPDRPREKPPVW